MEFCRAPNYACAILEPPAKPRVRTLRLRRERASAAGDPARQGGDPGYWRPAPDRRCCTATASSSRGRTAPARRPVLAEIALSALRQVDVRAHIRPFLEQLVAEAERRTSSCARASTAASPRASRARTRCARRRASPSTPACTRRRAARRCWPSSTSPSCTTSRGIRALRQPREDLRARSRRSAGSATRATAASPRRASPAVGLVQRSSSGRIVGSLAVSAPETRMTDERTVEVLAALRRASRRRRSGDFPEQSLHGIRREEPPGVRDEHLVDLLLRHVPLEGAWARDVGVARLLVSKAGCAA